MSAPTPDWVLLAEVLRSRGNKGEVSARSHTTGPERFLELGSISLLNPKGEFQSTLAVEDAWEHNGALILKFEGVDSISAAEALRGCRVAIPETERRPLAKGEYFLGDLAGCRVIDAGNQTDYGAVAAVHEMGDAPGLLELEDGTLIPIVKSICVGIHPGEGRIEVSLPEGLLELNH